MLNFIPVRNDTADSNSEIPMPPENWRNTVAGVVAFGQLIEGVRSRQGYDRLDFLKAVQQWGLNESAALRLSRLGKHPIISNPANASKLPSQWGKLYELALMPNEILQGIVDRDEAKSINKYQIWKMREEAGQRVKAAPRKARLGGAFNPDDKRIRHKMLVRVPAGETIFDHVERAYAFEQKESVPIDVAARHFNMGAMTYRQLRTVLLMSKRTDLHESDQKIIAEAKQAVIDGYSLGYRWGEIQPIVEKIYGKKYSVDKKSEVKRATAFIHAVSIMQETYMRTTEVEIPHLSREQSVEALRKIHEARSALRAFSTRIKRDLNDGEAEVRPQIQGVQGSSVDCDE